MRLGGVWTHAPPILTLTPMTLSLSFFPVSLSDVGPLIFLFLVSRSLSHSLFFFLSPCHSLSSELSQPGFVGRLTLRHLVQMADDITVTSGVNKNSRSPPVGGVAPVPEWSPVRSQSIPYFWAGRPYCYILPVW